MTEITKIHARVWTANVGGAETHSWIYLGFGGREFLLDTADTDFQVGMDQTFILGEGSNLTTPEYNDPRTPPLNTDDLRYFPVYLRMEGAGSVQPWCIEWASVHVNPGTPSELRYTHPSLKEVDEQHRIWLDDRYGKALYLRPDHDSEPH
ncbi:hypothetical protein [Streptomyces lavendulocolor]|uniref:hypothetical protein n=1 Tax=Streptomyces lavendulocolor TaxID=67316 RepID=UPI003C30AA0D